MLVDNASSDGTADLVEALGDRSVRVLRNAGEHRQGRIAAARDARGTGALRLHCDADCGPSVQALGRMLELAERYDVVVGSRLAPGAAVGRRQPVRRRIAGRSFVPALPRAAARADARPVLRLQALARAGGGGRLPRSGLNGWTFDAETLALARALGFSITETGIPWTDRAGSRLSMPRVIVPVTRELLEARARVRSVRRAQAARPAGAAAESRV